MNWLGWCEASERGGCPLVQMEAELDDQSGPLRDYLLSKQREFHGSMARAAAMSVEQGHFRSDLDPHQFAFELKSIILGFHSARRLLRDPDAKTRAKTAFDALIAHAKA